MGLDSELLAIGPFKRELAIAGALEYEPSSYDNVPEGYTVTTTLCGCATSDASRQLAEAVGCDVWDFATHELDPEVFDMELLEEVHPEEVKRLKALIACGGFVFMFLPNG